MLFFRWKYQSQTDLGGIRYFGYVATYTGGGAVQGPML
jgi:hypothetical protein